MQLDESFYRKKIAFFIDIINREFGNDMVLEKQMLHYEHMGYFSLSYKYDPLRYSIKIENELRTFDGKIKNERGEFVVLSRLVDFNLELTEEGITDFVIVLREQLKKNSFDWYLVENDHLYVISNGIKKRLRIEEIIQRDKS